MKILNKEEIDFLEYLINKKNTEDEKKIVEEFDFLILHFTKSYTKYFSDKELTKNSFHDSIRELSSIYENISISESSGVLNFFAPIIKVKKLETVNLSLDIKDDEELCQITYLISYSKNVDKIISKEIKLFEEWEAEKEIKKFYKAKR